MQMTIGEMYSYIEAAAIVTVMDLMVLHMHRQAAEIELNLPLDLNCSSLLYLCASAYLCQL